MRVALHFDPNHELLDPHGGYEVTEVVLRAMIASGAFATRITIGDLMLKQEDAMWTTDIWLLRGVLWVSSTLWFQRGFGRLRAGRLRRLGRCSEFGRLTLFGLRLRVARRYVSG